MTLDQALADAVPDAYGARWAVAHRAGDSYVAMELEGARTFSRQWMYNHRLRGMTLREAPVDLKWMPLAVGRIAA